MAFAEFLLSARPAAIRAIASRAHVYNDIAHTCSDSASRRAAFRVKVACVSRLLTIHGAVEIEELLPAFGLITVGLPTGRLHVPIEHLEPAAKRAVARFVSTYLSETCRETDGSL